MEEVEVCLTDHLDVLNNSAWVSNEVTLSIGGAEEEEAPELLPPETRDMRVRACKLGIFRSFSLVFVLIP